MKRALIGHTGFVGSNLLKQTHFDDLYNSKNIESIQGHAYDLLVIAGAPAAKWLANKEPDKDLDNIQRLCDSLKEVSAKQVLLISTIDVYPEPFAVDEKTTIHKALCHPYGKHRLFLEKFVAERFNCKVLRLPGLFGDGLKKNVIFDYLHHHEIEKIDTRNEFQFYFLKNLWGDCQKFLELKMPLLNLSCEPIPTGLVAEICLGKELHNPVLQNPIHYDVHSCYADQLGGKDGYCYTLHDVMRHLKTYVKDFKH